MTAPQPPAVYWSPSDPQWLSVYDTVRTVLLDEYHSVPGDAVPLVPATWDGLLRILDAHYPADIFVGGDTADPGPRIVALSREVARLRGIEKRAREYATGPGAGQHFTRDREVAYRAARLILGEDTPDV